VPLPLPLRTHEFHAVHELKSRNDIRFILKRKSQKIKVRCEVTRDERDFLDLCKQLNV